MRDGRWRPGSFVTAAIAIERARRCRWSSPATAVQTVEGRKVVFVRTKDGFEKRDVVLGQTRRSERRDRLGPDAGETIAATNTFSLKAELSKPGDED